MKINNKVCDKCGQEIRCSNFKRHYEKCEGLKIAKIEQRQDWLQSNGKYKCTYCNKEYSKMGIGNHVWRYHTEEGQMWSDKRLGIDFFGNSRIWNKGLTADTDDRVKKYTETLRNKVRSGISIGKGKGKKGWYKGYWCDSSWELAFIIYNLDHNINFERNKVGFKYLYQGIEKEYYPDFIMEDGTYVEIKGYEMDKDKAKFKYFPHQLKVLKYKDIKYAIDYAISKYGNEFVSLYKREQE